MEPIDIILIAAILLIIGGALAYIIKFKKSGRHCIGCPDSAACSSKAKQSSCGGNCSACSCSCGAKTKPESEPSNLTNDPG